MRFLGPPSSEQASDHLWWAGGNRPTGIRADAEAHRAGGHPTGDGPPLPARKASIPELVRVKCKAALIVMPRLPADAAMLPCRHRSKTACSIPTMSYLASPHRSRTRQRAQTSSERSSTANTRPRTALMRRPQPLHPTPNYPAPLGLDPRRPNTHRAKRSPGEEDDMTLAHDKSYLSTPARFCAGAAA